RTPPAVPPAAPGARRCCARERYASPRRRAEAGGLRAAHLPHRRGRRRRAVRRARSVRGQRPCQELARPRVGRRDRRARDRAARGRAPPAARRAVRSAMAVAVGACATLDAQQPPIRADRPFESGVEVTSITATVTDAEGHLVTDLDRAVFEVYEDGTRQEI